MDKHHLGRIREDISRLGFGVMRLPEKDGHIDRTAFTAMMDAAMAAGINYYDTAYMYHHGESEGALGTLLTQRYPRDSFFLADKLPCWMMPESAGLREMQDIFREQLQRLHTQRIDFYLLHSLSGERWQMLQRQGVLEFLAWLRQSGSIRYLGFSFHDTPAALEQIVAGYDWDFAQIQLNYYDWQGQQEAEGQYRVLEQAGLPVVVMEPVRGGVLAKPPAEARERLAAAGLNDPAVAALRWAASHDQVLTVLSGMSTLPQIAANCQAFSPFRPLDGQERTAIGQALEILRQRPFIPCTGCGYCLDGCPAHIDIPYALASLNDYNLLEHPGVLHGYTLMIEEGRGPEQCINCGACAQVCPQHIDGPLHLAALSNALTQWRKAGEPA